MLDYEPKSWIRLIFSVRGTVIPRIFPRLVDITVWTFALAFLNYFTDCLNGFEKLPHQSVGLVLGFLVVLRTNTAYDRFWEGRKLWGGIVNSSRTLLRLAVTYCGDARPLADLLTAYVIALRLRLRKQDDLAEVQPWVSVDVLRKLRGVSNAPMLLSYEMGCWIREQLKQGKIDSILAQHIDDRVRELIDLQGGCERILRTPIPYNYAVHIKQFIVLYLILLPLAVVPAVGFWAIPIMALMTFGLVGMEEAGVEVEDPFGLDFNDLPLEQITSNIERDALTLAQLVPPEVKPMNLDDKGRISP